MEWPQIFKATENKKKSIKNVGIHWTSSYKLIFRLFNLYEVHTNK